MSRWLIVVAALLAAAPAWGQDRAAASRRAALDQLLNALKVAPNEEIATALEAHIRQMWLEAGSPAVTLLMGRGLRDMQAGADEDAVADFDSVIDLAPDLAAAYDRRAAARFANGDTAGAINDIEAALAREARDFTALQELAQIAQSRNDWAGAYAAWQKVMEIDPKTEGGEARLNDLRRRALGEAT
jgi:tetratricopeptide (TPR) repeat protein